VICKDAGSRVRSGWAQEVCDLDRTGSNRFASDALLIPFACQALEGWADPQHEGSGAQGTTTTTGAQEEVTGAQGGAAGAGGMGETTRVEISRPAVRRVVTKPEQRHKVPLPATRRTGDPRTVTNPIHQTRNPSSVGSSPTASTEKRRFAGTEICFLDESIVEGITR